ncbi:TPR repeat [Pseudobutyrivibrio sp. OR37]|uniref:tetratricopeptide repeat protein n=1 Tax=Pseudobutyrivibrio sp. OR37 TaxID=1798186 RepID=UPI0008E63155|nr:tetratricopeptide repeat protein [Pseudobutyrivibrio sp. OR37]SFI30011.1 TPR repeat [Pseudobutyrivibrio sp. OR37]
MYSELLRKYGIDSQLEPEKIVDLLTGEQNRKQDIIDNIDDENRIARVKKEMSDIDDAIAYYLSNKAPEVTGISRTVNANTTSASSEKAEVVEEEQPQKKNEDEMDLEEYEKNPPEDPKLQNKIAWEYYKCKDYKKSAEWAQKAADNGKAGAMELLANYWYCGYGVFEPNMEKGTEYLSEYYKTWKSNLAKRKKELYEEAHEKKMSMEEADDYVYSDETVIEWSRYLAAELRFGYPLLQDKGTILKFVDTVEVGMLLRPLVKRNNPRAMVIWGNVMFQGDLSSFGIDWYIKDGRSGLSQLEGVNLLKQAAELGEKEPTVWLQRIYYWNPENRFPSEKYLVENSHMATSIYWLLTGLERGARFDDKASVEQIENIKKKYRLDYYTGILAKYNISKNQSDSDIYNALLKVKKQKEHMILETKEMSEKASISRIIGFLDDALSYYVPSEKVDLSDAEFLEPKGSNANQGMTYEDALRFLASEEEDYQEYGLEWLVKLADQGDMHSLAKLGDMYYMGNRVPKDIDKAFSYLKKAAEAGHIPSQFTLAFMYNKGEGTEIDSEEYAYWMKQAALGGEPTAMLNTGWNYINGYGLCRDPKKGIDWLEKSAENNEPRAMTALGECYYRGIGVSRDLYKAKEWLEKAINQGDKKDAEPFLNEVKRELNINDALRRGF